MATSLAKKAIDTNRGKVALLVTNQVSLHDHQPQKIDGKVYNFSSSQIPNLDRHVSTMTIPLQVLVLASFFAGRSSVCDVLITCHSFVVAAHRKIAP